MGALYGRMLSAQTSIYNPEQLITFTAAAVHPKSPHELAAIFDVVALHHRMQRND